MVDPKVKTLVARIYSKSKQGELNWKKTSDEDVFVVSYSNYSVQVSVTMEYVDHLDEMIDRHRLRILSNSGAIIEEFIPAMFDKNDFQIPPYELFRTVFECARRHAMGLNVAIDELLGEMPPPDLPF